MTYFSSHPSPITDNTLPQSEGTHLSSSAIEQTDQMTHARFPLGELPAHFLQTLCETYLNARDVRCLYLLTSKSLQSDLVKNLSFMGQKLLGAHFDHLTQDHQRLVINYTFLRLESQAVQIFSWIYPDIIETPSAALCQDVLNDRMEWLKAAKSKKGTEYKPNSEEITLYKSYRNLPKNLKKTVDRSSIMMEMKDKILYTLPLSFFRNNTNITSLDLNNISLTSLSPAIGLLKSLSCLHLENNALTSLPNEISECESLHHIKVTENPIVTLPEALLQNDQIHIDIDEDKLTPEIFEKLQVQKRESGNRIVQLLQNNPALFLHFAMFGNHPQ